MVMLVMAPDLTAQSDIPMGTWRAHFSYSRINHVAIANNIIYGAADNGIVVADRTDGTSLSTLTKLNGLKRCRHNGARCRAFFQQTDRCL